MLVIGVYIWQSNSKPQATQNDAPMSNIEVDDVEVAPFLNVQTNAASDDVASTRSLPKNLEVDVKGKVIDSLSIGINGLLIELSLMNTAAGQQDIFSATTDTNGEFVIRGVVPNDEYRLEVFGSGAYAGYVLNPLRVENNMDRVTITLDSIDLVSVDGMIVDVDNLPVSGFEILVRNIGMAFPGSKIVSDSSGFFQLNEFPAGDLQLSTDGEDHFKLSGISLQPNEYQNLILMLDKGGYHLSGWVSDDLGAPILQARVVLTAQFVHEGIESYSYRFRLTDKNGAFEFSELGGQEHKLVIDATGYESRTWSYKFDSFSDNLRIELQRL